MCNGLIVWLCWCGETNYPGSGVGSVCEFGLISNGLHVIEAGGTVH